jgi:hypothetical protein
MSTVPTPTQESEYSKDELWDATQDTSIPNLSSRSWHKVRKQRSASGRNAKILWQSHAYRPDADKLFLM